MNDLYNALGVPKDATTDDIRAAYRKKAKTAHPDAGGSTEAFQQIALAERVLTDEELRRKYDTTGHYDDRPDNTQAGALCMIDMMLNDILTDEKAVHRDILGLMKRQLEERIKKAKAYADEMRGHEIRLKGIAARFKLCKLGAPDIFAHMMQTKIDAVLGAISNTDMEIAHATRALELLGAFVFNRQPEHDDLVDAMRYAAQTGAFSQTAFRKNPFSNL